jgi:hypothetical protein
VRIRKLGEYRLVPLTRAGDAPQRQKRSCYEDDAGTTPSPKLSRGDESSADVRVAGGYPTLAAAFGSAALGAVARCEAVRRNCCNDPEARSPRAASGRAPDNPDSSTAPSNRADIAFVLPRKPTPRRREGKRCRRSAPTAKTPRTGGDCAPEALVSQGKSIQLVVVLLQGCGKYE